MCKQLSSVLVRWSESSHAGAAQAGRHRIRCRSGLQHVAALFACSRILSVLSMSVLSSAPGAASHRTGTPPHLPLPFGGFCSVLGIVRPGIAFEPDLQTHCKDTAHKNRREALAENPPRANGPSCFGIACQSAPLVCRRVGFWTPSQACVGLPVVFASLTCSCPFTPHFMMSRWCCQARGFCQC